MTKITRFRKLNDAYLFLHQKDRHESALVDIKYQQLSKEAVIAYVLRLWRFIKPHLISYAHVGIVKQPRGEITESGGFRRKDYAPGVFSCPPRADSVDEWNLCRNWKVALRCWSEQSEKHGNMKQGFNIKNEQ